MAAATRSIATSSPARSRSRCASRPIDPEQVEKIINGIHRKLESMGESEVSSDTIGQLVMDALDNLDQVAYVRFASVYRNFREVQDFQEFIGSLSGDGED